MLEEHINKFINKFKEFCQGSDCATCRYVKYKDRGERYACAIVWAVENALFEPVRNLDRFHDALEARCEWDKVCCMEEGDVFDWLYEPAQANLGDLCHED